MLRGDGDSQRLWLAAMVDASRDAIIGTTANGIILSCNRAAERLSGYTATELVGQPMAILAVPERARIEDEYSNKINKDKKIG